MKPKMTDFVRYFILFILFCIPIMILFYNKITKDNNTDTENIMQPIDKESIVNESLYTVEGTITAITFTDLSKTSRIKRLEMYLHLKTLNSSHEELKFRRYPALESDQQLHVGQSISLTAMKDDFPDFIEDEFSDYSEIVNIEPL